MITKEQAIEVLSKVLENCVHKDDADYIIAEFEEKLVEMERGIDYGYQ